MGTKISAMAAAGALAGTELAAVVQGGATVKATLNAIAALFAPPAWTAYTPAVLAASGAFTTVSAAGRYIKYGKLVHFEVAVTITAVGTAGTAVDVALPVNAATANFIFAGRENAVTGALLVSWTSAASNMRIQKYDGTFIGANGYVLVVSGTYEAA